MMRPMAFVTGILLAAVSPYQAMAQTSGNDLTQWCERSDHWSQGVCFGYFLGSIEGVWIGAERMAQTRSGNFAPGSILEAVNVCVPEGVNYEQIMDIFRAHMSRLPEERHRPAVELMRESMAAAFPCRS